MSPDLFRLRAISAQANVATSCSNEEHEDTKNLFARNFAGKFRRKFANAFAPHSAFTRRDRFEKLSRFAKFPGSRPHRSCVPSFGTRARRPAQVSFTHDTEPYFKTVVVFMHGSRYVYRPTRPRTCVASCLLLHLLPLLLPLPYFHLHRYAPSHVTAEHLSSSY